MQKSNPVTIHIAGGEEHQRVAILELLALTLHDCRDPEGIAQNWTSAKVALVKQTICAILQSQEVKITSHNFLLTNLSDIDVADTYPKTIPEVSAAAIDHMLEKYPELATSVGPFGCSGGVRSAMFKDRVHSTARVVMKGTPRTSTGVLEHGFFIYVELSSESTTVTARCPVTRLPLPTSLAVRAWVDEAKTVIAESPFYNDAVWTTAQVKNGLETILLDHFATVSSFKGVVVEDNRGQ